MFRHIPAVEPIRYYDRHAGCLATEVVYGERFLDFAYGNPLGRLALHALVKRRVFSRWYGWRMNRPASAERIAPFIRQFGIDPDEFAVPPEQFRTFNEFFARHLRPGARPVDPDPAVAVFPADARHLGFPRAAQIDSVFVKGRRFNLERLLGGDRALVVRFAGGPMVVSRLCPVDYHRFHFPVAGVPGPAVRIDGPLFSVSPVALRERLSILWENHRALTRLESPGFGLVLIVDIGATCVGSIRQTYEPNQPVAKGAEKGCFGFGGSLLITLFEPGRIELAPDLVKWSARHVELYARTGTPMGRRSSERHNPAPSA